MHVDGIQDSQDREQEMLKQAEEHTGNSDRHLEMNHVRNHKNISGLVCFLFQHDDKMKCLHFQRLVRATRTVKLIMSL